mmetsp:Transcript_776/g.833  ORF Transcript_776/g.833 Transcript_776/m.833 type:complete len:154 (+) Transcript_776:150-611(+)
MSASKNMHSMTVRTLLLAGMFLFRILAVSSFCVVPPQSKISASHLAMSSNTDNMNEVVACRILLKGDVGGGYYRSCVKNEATQFRNLCGTMTPPDDDTAEIYVEGKRKTVEGFVRWCERADKKVGMSQIIKVESVSYEDEPTGLYDGFYIGTN